jgi:hypothetical protein
MVSAEPLDHGRARLVQADHLNVRSVATKLQNYIVQRADCGDVPEMRIAHVNADALGHVLVIKGIDEAIGGREEHLPGYKIGDLPTVFRQLGDDPEQPGNQENFDQRTSLKI